MYLTVTVFDLHGRPLGSESTYVPTIHDLRRIEGLTEPLRAEVAAGRSVVVISSRGRRDIDPRGRFASA